MLYLTIYILAALLALGIRRSPRVDTAFYAALLLIFFLVAAFRFEVGCDWGGYLVQYRYDKALETPDAALHVRDPLWWWYLRSVRNLGLSYPWLNILPTVIFFAGAHVLARRQPDRFAFLVLLWPILIINIAMSGLRQAAAIGILCVAYKMFVERRAIWFTLLVVLAATIHSSAMIFLLLVPLVNGQYSRGRIALAVLLAIPGGLIMINSAAADVALSRYVDTDTDAAGAVFRVGLLTLSGIVFLIFLRRPWLKSGAPDFKLVSVGSLAMICLGALLPLSTVIADRLGYYLVPIQAIMLARIPFLPTLRSKTLYILIAYVALGLALAVWVSLSSHYEECYTPYKTWLFGMPHSTYGM